MTAPFITMDIGSVKGAVEKIGRTLDVALDQIVGATRLAMVQIANDVNAEASQRINARTGDLKRAATVEEPVLEGDQIVVRFGFNRRYARQRDQGGEIRPKNGQLLAIPLDPILTAQGVSRYASPLEEPDLKLVKLNGRLFLVKEQPKGGAFKAKDLNAFHWMLVPSVNQKGSGFFSDPVKEATPDMPRRIAERVGQILDRTVTL